MYFSDQLNMESLIFFKHQENEQINILEEIGSKYYDFGILLLQDRFGKKVAIIEQDHKNDTLRILREIAKLWQW